MEKKIIKLLNIKIVLHEHFVYPCEIRNGNYMPPKDHGYSIEMKEESVREYSFPLWKILECKIYEIKK